MKQSFVAKSLSLVILLTATFVFAGLDGTYPSQNFLALGPFSPQTLSIHEVISDYNSGNLPENLFRSSWKLSNGEKYEWKYASRMLFEEGDLTPEKIKIDGIENLKIGQAYILRTTLHNTKEQHVRYICDSKSLRYLFLDGKKIARYNGILKKGDTELVFIYIHQAGNENGIKLRILNAYSGDRVTDITYLCENTLELVEKENSTTNIKITNLGTLEFNITDKFTCAAKACRIYVFNDRGEPQYDENWPECFGHFACEGNATLTIPEGNYTYEIESGKEFYTEKGSLRIVKGKTLVKNIALVRFADITSEGWYGGDMHNHTKIEVTPMLMKSENIHITYVPWWWINHSFGKGSEKSLLEYDPLIQFDGNRFIYTRAGEDERRDATLMFFNIPEDVEIGDSNWTFPPTVHYAETFGKMENVWVHLDHMFWWQMPALLASGELNSIEVINNNFTREGVNDTEAWGKPRDMKKYPHPFGNAKYQQDVYFEMLNCGIFIPPVAGSAACVGGEPFGYNRVYVKVDGELTWEKWWQNLAKGRCFITNGPLLRAKANGKLPGHTFKPWGNNQKINFDIELDSRDKVTQIQVIYNGKIVSSTPYSQWLETGKIPAINCTETGWVLIRVLTDNPGTYRLAMTAPYFIEIGKTKKRISKKSVEFFLDWAQQATKHNSEITRGKRQTFDAYSKQTIDFWKDLLTKANAE